MRESQTPPSLRIDPVSRSVTLSPTDPVFVQDPYGAYRALRDAGLGAFFWQDYGFWCFSDHATVGALFRDRRLGREVAHVADPASLGWEPPPPHCAPFTAFEANTMLEREPPVHTRLRTLVNRAFVSRTVERLRPRLEALSHALIDAFPASGQVDLLPAYAEPIPLVIIAELLGVPPDMGPQLLDWSHRMVAMYQFGRTRAVEDSAVAATEAFVAFIRALLPERRRTPGEDILSVLLAAEAEGGRLSEDEVIATAILLLNAGHEATVHAIGNGVSALLEAGLAPAPLFADATATQATVEELLRFAPPLHLFTRYVLEPVTLAGIDFRCGDKIGLMIGAANRDPAVFAEPDRLDPRRPARPHHAFGGGIHFCIGAPLARLELAVALPILFARCPRLRANGASRLADRYHFHGRERVPITF